MIRKGRNTKAAARARIQNRRTTPAGVLPGIARPHAAPSREVLDARAAMVAKAFSPGNTRARGIDRTARMGIAYRGAA